MRFEPCYVYGGDHFNLYADAFKVHGIPGGEMAPQQIELQLQLSACPGGHATVYATGEVRGSVWVSLCVGATST